MPDWLPSQSSATWPVSGVTAREIRNLAEFDDRMLSDIGLTRSEVMGALAEPFLRQRAVHLVRREEQSARAEKVGKPAEIRPAVSFAAQTGSRA